MPQRERVRVFNGELKKTSGGLTRDQLVRNKRGKIVSKKKSGQAAGGDNNLGSWLRNKGDKFKGKPKGFKEEEEDDDRDDEKMSEVPVKKKAAPKKAQKKAAPKKAASKKAASHLKKAVPKIAKKKKLEPIKPGEGKDLSKISVGNIFVETKTDYELDWEFYKGKKKMSDQEAFKRLGKPTDAEFAKLQSKKIKMFVQSKM